MTKKMGRKIDAALIALEAWGRARPRDPYLPAPQRRR
jgi:hypothetical protein